jgi:AraC-like DNA-binding protein
VDDVAAALALSTRTLQRKLAEAGTNFQAVHDAARQALAKELLRDSRLNLTDVAFMLGYREQSSFNRACREWFGNTPARTRERLRGASAGSWLTREGKRGPHARRRLAAVAASQPGFFSFLRAFSAPSRAWQLS